MVRKVTTWQCAMCGTEYQLKKDANTCEIDRPVHPPIPDMEIQPGNFVVPSNSAAWCHDEFSDWLLDRGAYFEGQTIHDHRYQAYWFVTAVRHLRHEWGSIRAHQKAAHLYNGGGWMYEKPTMRWFRSLEPQTGYFKVVKDEDVPPALIKWRTETGHRLIGNHAQTLL